MAVDDVVETEVALAVAATAALCSPPVRALLRWGAIAGVAGVLTVADALRARLQSLQLGEHGVELARSRVIVCTGHSCPNP